MYPPCAMPQCSAWLSKALIEHGQTVDLKCTAKVKNGGKLTWQCKGKIDTDCTQVGVIKEKDLV